MKKILFWLKTKVSNLLFYFFQKSSIFDRYLDYKIRTFYETESLKIPRIWGDRNKLILGQHTQLNNAVVNTISGKVIIGDYCFFGHGVYLLTGSHDITKYNFDRQTTIAKDKRDIIIGKGVWIASNAIIVGPCEIGDHTVIGSNSYVTGILESYAFYAGIPAKKIKSIPRKSNNE